MMEAEKLIKAVADIDLLGAVALELGKDHKDLMNKTNVALTVLES
jgi:hypothetical protein